MTTTPPRHPSHRSIRTCPSCSCRSDSKRASDRHRGHRPADPDLSGRRARRYPRTRADRDEATWGRTYWEKVWRCGRPPTVTDTTREQAVWAQLAGRFGPQRAAWIARLLEPTNVASRPAAAVAEAAPVPSRDRYLRSPLRAAPPGRALRGLRSCQTAGSCWATDRTVGACSPSSAIRFPIRCRSARSPIRIRSRPPDLDHGRHAADRRWHALAGRLQPRGRSGHGHLGAREHRPGHRWHGAPGRAGCQSARPAGPGSATRCAAGCPAFHARARVRPAGDPTNNTPEVSAGDGATHPGHRQSFVDERNGPLFVKGNGANGDVAATALGVPSSVFTHVAHAGDDDQVLSRHLNAALWPATWGYYLEQRLFGAVPDDTLDRIRKHFVSFVRADGPLPASAWAINHTACCPRHRSIAGSRVTRPSPGTIHEHLQQLRDAYRRALPRVPAWARSTRNTTRWPCCACSQ